MGRDLSWDAMVTVAERLDRRSTDTIRVWAYRRHRPWRVTEGLDAGDNWVSGLEQPVRWRRLFSRTWHEIQPVEDAASEIGRFLRERPDLQ